MQHPLWPPLFLSTTSCSSSCISEHIHLRISSIMHATVGLLLHLHWTAESVTESLPISVESILIQHRRNYRVWLLQQWNQLFESPTTMHVHVENFIVLVGQEQMKKNAFGIRTKISLKIELDQLLIWRYWQKLVDWDSLYIMNVGT